MSIELDKSEQADTSPKIVVILNSESGKGDTKPSAEKLEDLFRSRGTQVRVVTVSGGSDIPRQVRDAIGQPGIECVVAAGGDGTICAVAGALSKSGIDLGVLPLGTFNYFARRFEIPEEVEGAVDAVCQGRTETIDLGSVNGRVFINNASIGLYPSILKVREDIYRRWGRSRLAAYWSVVVAMATVYRPLTMSIDIDGTREGAKTPTVFVAMSAYQLDEFGIEGSDAVRAGKFAVYLAPDCGRVTLMWKAMRVALSGVKKGQDFALFTGYHAVVSTKRKSQLIALDGERERMEGPFDFGILKDALKVRVPAAAAAAGPDPAA